MTKDKDRDEAEPGKDDKGVSGDQLPVSKRSSKVRARSKGNVEVPADALNEAVGQLKQLTALRKQEAERQEKAIEDMQAAMQRQGKTNGWMVFLSLLLLGVAGAGVYYFVDLRDVTESQRQDIAQVGELVNAEVGRQTELLSEMENRVEATRQAVTEEVGRQAETLVGIEQAVSATRSEQTERLAAVETEFARSINQVGNEQAAAMASVREAVEQAQREQAQRLAASNEAVTRTLTEVASGQTVALGSVNDQVNALREQLAVAQTENAELNKMMDEAIRATEAAIADRVEESVAASNEAVTRTLTEVASGQTVALVSVNDQVNALREQLAVAQTENAELTTMMDEKIRATEAAIAARVEESVAAVRAERDQILAEMGRLLEERMAELDAREGELEQRQAALAEAEERFNRQAEASRERMRMLLNDALGALTPQPAVAEPGSVEPVAAVAEPEAVEPVANEPGPSEVAPMPEQVAPAAPE